jgi:GNAT superfamily N-acetyltransferase
MFIKPIDLKQSSQREYALVNDCMNRVRAERLPDDPPVPLDEHINSWLNLPPMLDIHGWTAWRDDESEVVGWGIVYFMNTNENQHVVQFEMEVQADVRRQGLGRRLLAEIVEVPRREGRRLMVTETSERIPGGAAFMNRLGARMGLAMHINQLTLADVDQDQIFAWIERAKERASGFELGFWDGAYPDAELPAVAALHEAMNLAPRDDLDFENRHITPEQLRQMEQYIFSRGDQRWTMYVRERASGEFAGFTEVMWNPNRPDLANQGATAVWPKYRNKGLGRWLKAAMLEKVLRDRPQVKRVRTGNADSNAAMLRINEELGFKPYQSQTFWQVETDKVLAYLGIPQPVAIGVSAG